MSYDQRKSRRDKLLVTSKAMRELDRRAIEKYGIPALILMENAGRAVAEETRKILRSKKLDTIAVLCGPGNNGGDGLVAARHLFNWGFKARIFYFGNVKETIAWGGATGINLRIVLKMEIPVTPMRIGECGMRDLQSVICHLKSSLVIDALFGIGLDRPLREPYLGLIKKINNLRVPVVAVDIPSGLDTDKGIPLGEAIKASVTVTFAAPKIGLVKLAARGYVGRLVVADIGIPHRLLKR